MILKTSDTFRFVKDKIEEGSKGIEIPLEPFPGHLLEISSHNSLQKVLRINELMGLIVYTLKIYKTHILVFCPPEAYALNQQQST